MVSDIVDGISNALYENFEGVDILSEGIEQGFTEPCFFIMVVDASEKPLIGNRAIRDVLIDIHYFPEDENEPNAEIERVASNLYGVLRRIELPDGTLLNGLKLRHENKDLVLHFFVEYKPIVHYESEIYDDMETLTNEIEVRND